MYALVIVFIGPNLKKQCLLEKYPSCIFIRGNHDRYLLEKLWEDESPSLEGMDPNDPICKAIVKNGKWTADFRG